MTAPAISGYISTGADRQKAEIVSIAVHPDQRNRGIATALMTDTPAGLRRRGVRTVELMVRTTNRLAVRFYSRFGFKRLRRVARYYDDDAAGFPMRKRLTGKLERMGNSG